MCVEAIWMEWVLSVQGVCGRRRTPSCRGDAGPFSFSPDAHRACPALDECQAESVGTLEGWQPSKTDSFAGFSPHTQTSRVPMERVTRSGHATAA